MGSLACRRTRKGCDSKAFYGDFEVFPVSWSVNKHRRLCSVTIQPPPLPLCPEAEAPRTQFWKIEERIHHSCLTHRLPEGNPFLFVSSSNLSLFFFFFPFSLPALVSSQTTHPESRADIDTCLQRVWWNIWRSALKMLCPQADHPLTPALLQIYKKKRRETVFFLHSGAKRHWFVSMK